MKDKDDSDDNIVISKQVNKGFGDKELSWYHICNRIQHEMYKDLSIMIKLIIDDKNNDINIDDKIKDKSIKYILNILQKKKNLDNQQINYIQQLIDRSIHITTS